MFLKELFVGGIYLGAGAKLLIGVHLADNIIVGANAVVTKSFEENNIVIEVFQQRKYQTRERNQVDKKFN